MKRLKQILSRIFLFLLIANLLVSCANYSDSFSCPDARGGKCLSIDKIDRLIDSGEIKKVIGLEDKVCTGKKCCSKKNDQYLLQSEVLPSVKTKDKKAVFFSDDGNGRN